MLCFPDSNVLTQVFVRTVPKMYIYYILNTFSFIMILKYFGQKRFANTFFWV